MSRAVLEVRTASRRSRLSSRRLCGEHNSTIDDGLGQAADAAAAIVAKV
jgi:hypothetical protein